MGILLNLEPKPVFRYFEEICGIPRGSGNTKAVSDYCVAFAKEHNLKYIQDSINNVIIFKDGTKGYENSAPVMLQGHLDMVCEKDKGCDIDFSKDGLVLQLDGNTVTAKGTTLGGDDGIAIAYALAILAADDIPHPPLEAVFTVDEEIGLLGATALDCSPLKARTMLNIDSEEEGYLLVSCAGGASATASFPLQRQDIPGIPVTLTVSGLVGGHSGTEIDKGRANACKLLGRTLYALQKEFTFCAISINGGLKDNAIPRDASAQLLFAEDTDMGRLRETVSGKNAVYKKEYQKTDAAVTLTLTQEQASFPMRAMTEESSKKTIAALVCSPNGIQGMNMDIKGLVQTSLNLGILTTSEDAVSLSFCLRSSVETEKEEMIHRICCLSDALGGTVSVKGMYPAWEYRKDSPLRDLMVRVFKEQYGKEPVVQALHAGVECGLFAGKLPGLDCVSFGPDLKDIHTPNESMDVQSVRRTWDYILEILKQLK